MFPNIGIPQVIASSENHPSRTLCYESMSLIDEDEESLEEKMNNTEKKPKYQYDDCFPQSTRFQPVTNDQISIKISPGIGTTHRDDIPHASSHKVSADYTRGVSDTTLTKESLGCAWFARYEELKEFWAQNGHFSVSSRDKQHKQLKSWIIKQRSVYRKKCEGIRSSMTTERVLALEKIGFKWGKSTTYTKWQRRYFELLTFKQKHGHCHISRSDGQNKQLVSWLDKQRYEYKQKTAGKPSSMTPERIAKLQTLGFDWAHGNDARWQRRYSELLQFKQQHGHCNVPKDYAPNKQLGAWVHRQRYNYMKRNEGKESLISPEHIALLKKIGIFSKNVLVME